MTLVVIFAIMITQQAGKPISPIPACCLHCADSVVRRLQTSRVKLMVKYLVIGMVCDTDMISKQAGKPIPAWWMHCIDSVILSQKWDGCRQASLGQADGEILSDWFRILLLWLLSRQVYFAHPCLMIALRRLSELQRWDGCRQTFGQEAELTLTQICLVWL